MRKMKDSGIEWIGEIPENWEVMKNKYILSSMYSGGTPGANNADFYTEADDGVPFVSISDMSATSYIHKTQKKLTSEGLADKNLKILPVGTILYSIYATIGAVSELKIEAAISQAMLALRLKNNINKQYYKYCLSAMREYVFGVANGNTQFNLNAEKVWNYMFPIPNMQEQEKITNYLDQKFAEIDAIIAAKEKTNELLKERRQSIIYEAVTKGLDPTVPMKDSGVEWIGEIPENWSVVALKRVAKPSTGMTPNKANPEYWDGDIPWFSSKDIKEFYLTDSEDHITEKAIEDCGLTLYDANSVVFCARSGILRHTFPVAVMKCQGTINQDLRVLTTANSVDPDFLMYYLRGMNNTIVTLYQKIGATVESIETDWLLYLPTVLPPIEEQRTIANGITARCDEINNLITTNNISIQKLKEYRQSVIYEAVTGKVEI